MATASLSVKKKVKKVLSINVNASTPTSKNAASTHALDASSSSAPFNVISCLSSLSPQQGPGDLAETVHARHLGKSQDAVLASEALIEELDALERRCAHLDAICNRIESSVQVSSNEA